MRDPYDRFDRMEWGDDPAYHRGCGGTVTVKHHDATWSEWDGGTPAETTITCSVCGDIGDGELSESPQEPCEGCGTVLTDGGFPCRRCEDAEEEGSVKSDGTQRVA